MIDVMGETLVDLIESPEPGLYRAVPGGSPANVALGLARLGSQCRFLGRISTDRFGMLGRRRLLGSGVDMSATVSTDLLSTMAVVSLDQDASARYTFYVTDTADWAWRDEELPGDVPEAFHVGSLAAAIPPGRDVITRHLRRLHDETDCFVSYDPNIRPLVTGDHVHEVERVHTQARFAHLVKLSVEDLGWLHPGITPEDGIAALRTAGVSADVILTFGSNGAVLYRADGETIRTAGVAVSVSDTVGAGDAFSAAVLAELDRLGLFRVAVRRPVDTPQWRDVLGFANRVAAESCRRAGADPPRRSELPA